MTANPAALTRARQDDTARRRQRVLDALKTITGSATEPTVSAVATVARVHRSFIYRHPDLHAAVLAQLAQPSAAEASGTQLSRNSLLADLANMAERNARLAQQVTQLENALSEALGGQAWRESGLGAPTDTDQLQQRVQHLELQLVDLQQLVDERDEELAAARAANRELLAHNNRPRR
jgi:dynactin complex subunit